MSQRLIVNWQSESTREIVPVAELVVRPSDGVGKFEFGRDSFQNEKAWRIFAILVPPIVVKQPFRDKLWEKKEVICVPAPPPGFKTIFALWMSHPHVTADNIRALPKDRPMEVIGSVKLKTRTVWVLAYRDKFRTEIELPVIEEALAQVQFPMGDPSNIVNAYVHSFNVIQQVVTDIQIGREHCVVDQTFKPGDKIMKIIKTTPRATGAK